MGSGTTKPITSNPPTSPARISRSKFVLPEETIVGLAEEHLRAPAQAPDGREEKAAELDLSKFETALEQALLARFIATEEARISWEKAQPIALGSWARGELCPKSDLDLLFVGDESAAASVTRHAQEAGIKIRSRVPENIEDWTKGVEAFDVLALLAAKPLTDAAMIAYEAQLAKLHLNLKSVRRSYFSAIRKERRARNERFDSITNFLEPNLKYGPGGLRDMGQAFQLRLLFPERFESPERLHALAVFEYYRKFFLLSRIRVQLSEGGGDLLSAHEQAEVAKWFGFESSRDFMREIQKGLSRVSFYADVDFEHVRVSEKELARLKPKDLGFTELAQWLEREPSTLVQAKARDLGFKLYRKSIKRGGSEAHRANEALRNLLVKTIDPLEDDRLTIAFFRSRWIDLAVTDFKKIVGYVQHDQYHRYTVDAHLMQAVREMKRVAQRPTILGRLGAIAKQLSREDWKILGWTALYHDVGKGSGGDHSDKSVVIAREDLAKWNVADTSIDEVIWLIENHLELSMAAFRGNPAHPTTWRALHAKGIEGKRLLRLAIFTAVDIRATNREAYTPWKERLLSELVKNLEMPEAKQLSKLEKELMRSGYKFDQQILDRLDPFLVSAIPVTTLAKDLKTIVGEMSGTLEFGYSQDSIAVKVQTKAGRVWIRFHTKHDRTGLFAQMARTLQAAGLSVRHASVLSDPQVGVYDWFEIKPPRTVKGLEAKLSRLVGTTTSISTADKAPLARAIPVFDEIECLSQSESEWVVSFRGRDSRGALLLAAEALASEGLSITWAKVHTWGRQIDDVFGVAKLEGTNTQLTAEDLVARLKSRIGRQL